MTTTETTMPAPSSERGALIALIDNRARRLLRLRLANPAPKPEWRAEFPARGGRGRRACPFAQPTSNATFTLACA